MKRYTAAGLGRVLALGALMGTAPSAFAGDQGSALAMLPWSGFHLGVGAGWNFLSSDLKGREAFNGDFTDVTGASSSSYSHVSSATARGSDDDSAFFGTVEGGYDHRLVDSRWVIGAFANFDFGQDAEIGTSGEGLSTTTCVSGDCGPGTIEETAAHLETSLSMGNSWAIGGRLGYLVHEDLLLYGLVGFTQAEFTLKGRFYDCGCDYRSSTSDWTNGYVIGAGLERMFTPSVSGKIEYRYANYDGLSLSQLYDDGSVAGRLSASASDPDVHSVRAVLSWRFDRPVEPTPAPLK